MTLATTPLRYGALGLLLAAGLAAPAARAQCAFSSGGITVELVLDGRNSDGTYTYDWNVRYAASTPWITELYFQRASNSAFTSVIVNPDLTTWTYQSALIPTTAVDALKFTYASGLKLQRNRVFEFGYTTTFQDPVRVQARASDGTVFDQTFTGSQCLLLPVELTTFTGAVDGASARLAWATASETNNAGFHVEQRGAAGTWAEVGYVRGAGTTAERQSYTHTTEALAPGRYTFRLRQVDLDGRTAYSPEVQVEVGLAGAYEVGRVYPNPARTGAALDVAVSRAQGVTVEAFDLTGRRLAELYRGELGAGARVNVPLALDGLAAGLYVVRVKGETFEQTQRLAVTR